VVAAILGGVLIGGAAGALMLVRGRVAGVSGMAGGLVTERADLAHRAAFLIGLALVGFLAALLHAPSLGTSPLSLPAIALGGVLVGYGSARSGGCTSGHGVCGLARLSGRSLIATLTFMATAALTVWVTR
jgi:uncharacterized membrane protein YedE/YeeE